MNQKTYCIYFNGEPGLLTETVAQMKEMLATLIDAGNDLSTVEIREYVFTEVRRLSAVEFVS